MAKESLAKKLRRYNEELNRARKFLQDEGYLDLWERMVDLYRGRHYDEMSESDRLIVNMAFPTINAIAPSVAVNNPKFIVQARKPEAAPQAIISQEVLNYLWRTHKFQRQFRLAVNDSLAIGHGWLKVGYKRVKKPVEKMVDGDEQPGYENRSNKPGDSENEYHVVDDRPFVVRVSYSDMFVDPDGRNLDEITWIAQRVRRPVSDVKVDPRYDRSARSKVTATSWKWRAGFQPSNPHEESQHTEENSIGYVDVIEFYDLRARTVCTFAADCGADVGFLRDPEPMPYAFGHPFVMIRNYEVPDYFYPMGELEQIESLQHELNETRTQMMQHRRRNARKWLVAKERFDDEAFEALESDEDNVIVKVIGGDDPQTAIAPMPGQPIQGDAYSMSDVIQNDINVVTATSDYARGNAPQIRRTATEAAMIQDAQNARAADKLAAIEGYLAECGARVIQLMQQYMSGQQVIRVVGMSNMPMWVQFDKDYIAGEFDFEVEGGSTQPRNESFRRQSALQFMDAVAPFIGQGIVDPTAAARHVLTEFGIKNPDSFLAAPQMPAGAPPGAMGAVPAGAPPMAAPAPMQAPDAPPPMGDQIVPGIPDELMNQVMAQSGVQFAA